MLKPGIYWIYNRNEYEIMIDMDNNIKIMTEDKGKIDSTFVDVYNSGLYTKIVNANELKDCVG